MKKDFTPFFLVLFVLLTGNLSISAQSEELSIHEFNDISYYEAESSQPEKTKLNLLIPEGIVNPPVFMWIGQGAWAYVDRNKEMNICRMMAKQGIAMASVGHRLSPALIWEPKNEEGVKHPEHVKDIALAFKWVYENSEKYGYSKENIFVGGYSSGAHLATLLAMDNRYLADLGLTNKMIKAIIPVGGGYDVPHYLEDLKKEDPAYEFNHINPVFGETHEEHIDASPVTYIDSLITPILMISEKDTYLYSKVFEDLLIEKKINDFQVINAHNKTHGGLWKDLGNSENSIYRNFIVDYIKQRSSE
jgi:hypothetical protein